MATGTMITCDAPALCCVFAGGRKIVAGDVVGQVHFLSLELYENSHHRAFFTAHVLFSSAL